MYHISITFTITFYMPPIDAMLSATVTAMANRPDFLDEIVDERSKANPQFPDLVQAALEARAARRKRAIARQDRRPAAAPQRNRRAPRPLTSDAMAPEALEER
jgi:hypothetical protein